MSAPTRCWTSGSTVRGGTIFGLAVNRPVGGSLSFFAGGGGVWGVGGLWGGVVLWGVVLVGK